MSKTWLSLLLVICLCYPSVLFAKNDVLTLGILAAEPKAKVLEEWQPLADYLASSLKIKQLKIKALNFNELETELQNQHLDFVLTNPSHYIALKEQNALSTALATVIDSHNNQLLSAFGGVIFCLNNRDDINTLVDLKNKTIASVSSLSLGGYHSQIYELSQAGIALPKTKNIIHTDMPHDRVVEMVLNGKADVGFIRTETLENFSQQHKIPLSRFKIINQQHLSSFPFLLSTRLYPQWPFVALPHVPPTLAQKVAASLLLLEPNSLVFKNAHFKKFVVALDYGVVEDLLRELRLPPFDDLPSFTFIDVWQRYRQPLLIAVISSALILFLLVMVSIKNRQLRLTQQQLFNSEQRNRLILNCAGEGIFGLDLTGKTSFINPTACRILGYQANEMIGKSLHCLIHHSYKDGTPYPEDKCPMSQAHLQGISMKVVDEVLWRKDNTCFPAEYSCNPILDGTDILGSVIVFSDISERKRTIEQLANERALFRGVIDGIPDLIFFKDVKSVYLGCNKAFEHYINKTEAEIIGKTDFDLVDAETAQFFRDKDKAVLNSGKIGSNEEWIVYPDGRKILVEVHKIPYYRADHTLLGVIGISHDITEMKQLLENMRCAEQRANDANQAKSEFLANMSHEIRTPMNAILGFTSILSDLLQDSIHGYYLQAIDRSAKTLLRLINDILDLSKIEAGKFSIRYAPLAIRPLLEDIGIVFSSKITEKSLFFSIDVAETVPEVLVLDEIRLRQVLLNLVGNAIKFTDKGFVKIGVLSQPSSQANKITLIITVSDSGIGIPQQQQEQIFAAFTQQEQQKNSYGGTGLGLTISRRLLELMNGFISVNSEVDKGSCFTLQLDDVDVAEPHSLPHQNDFIFENEPQTIRFTPANILVVDDVATNRALIKAYLADFTELHLTEAETAAQVLQLVKQQKFDLIFMDRRLPDQDGEQVCKQIKAIPDYADIPIIMISATVVFNSSRSSPYIYNEQLNKPVSKNQLIFTLEKFLPFQRYLAKSSEEKNFLVSVDNINLEKLHTLQQLLVCDYQSEVSSILLSGFVEVDRVILLAKKLITLGQDYDCKPLYTWAKSLKSQAELFNLEAVNGSLKSFDTVLLSINVQLQSASN